MKLETKILIIALFSVGLAIPVSLAMQRHNHGLRIEKTEKQQLQLKIETLDEKAEQDRQQIEKQRLENEQLQKDLEAKKARKLWLTSLEFPVGGAPAWKVRDALAHYLDAGLSKTASAYLVGNLVAESKLDHTNKSGDGGKAHGLAQWHPNRRHDMPEDYHGQLAFVLVEMKRQTPEAYNLITNNPTPSQAARAMKIFEAYGVEGRRFHYAEQIAARLP